MKGPLANTATGKYQINFSEYNTGISKEEYASTADSAVAGAYARSTAVAVGGYLASRTHQTLNDVEALEKGSDCGSRTYLEIKLPAKFKQEYLYRYIKASDDSHDLILLTEENYDQYVNTIVKMRSPMFCHAAEPHYCNKCLGDQPYLFELQQFGLAIARLSNTLLNLQLKCFHAMTVKVSEIDCNNLLHWQN